MAFGELIGRLRERNDPVEDENGISSQKRECLGSDGVRAISITFKFHSSHHDVDNSQEVCWDRKQSQESAGKDALRISFPSP